MRSTPYKASKKVNKNHARDKEPEIALVPVSQVSLLIQLELELHSITFRKFFQNKFPTQIGNTLKRSGQALTFYLIGLHFYTYMTIPCTLTLKAKFFSFEKIDSKVSQESDIFFGGLYPGIH